MRSIVFVSGSKGGTGKSILSAAILDYLDVQQKSWFLIDTDTSNPDVWKAYCNENQDKGATINLDSRDGWIDLVNTIETREEECIVINTASRLSQSTQDFSVILTEVLAEVDRSMVSAWVINRQRDSLQLLKKHLDTMPEHTTCVFRNLFFGDIAKYTLYNNSNVKKEVESTGITLDIPELADRVVDQVYTERKTFEMATGVGNPIGNRSELQRWRRLMHAQLEQFFSFVGSQDKASKSHNKSTATKGDTADSIKVSADN
ncbi:protein mobD [Halomonas elongata]|uniref:nucleotide-binding protein n=1 Tax=Halomonas elongata TaxID=2746 RepID=UPI00255AF817|nr:protein mobD [Halomonas elongata]MDL4860773.1 protein mobD [Halomonas elongata]